MKALKLATELVMTCSLSLPLFGAEYGPGVVAVWGSSNSGQRGVPVDLTNAVAIAAGFRHSIALRADGTLEAWGANDDGETAVPAGLGNVVALAAGGLHNLALRGDTTVAAWGYNHAGQANVPPGLTGVVAVAAGAHHSLALKTDGTIVGWGRNSEGQCDPPADATNVVAIGAGGNHSLALRRDGTAIAWGTEPEHQMQSPPDWTNITTIACGYDHALALRQDHTVSGWAYSAFGSGWGQTNLPAGLSNVVAIAAGTWNGLALRADGAVLTWGRNQFGEGTVPGDLTNAVALAAGADHSLALIARQKAALVVDPVNTTAFTGKPAELFAVATGTAPLSYQWQKEGANLLGATDDRLAWTTIQFGDAGDYRVVVSNALGAVTSRLATLTVIERSPFIVGQPADQSLFPSCAAGFEVGADGSWPLAYQWLFDGNTIPGATNTTLVIARVTAAHAGDYAVVVANDFGSVTSRTAILSVLPLPTGPGSLDVTFDPTAAGTAAGIEADTFPPFVGSLGLQADGKLLIGGRFDRINGVAHRGLARLHTVGTLDPSYQFACANELVVVAFVQQHDEKLLFLGRRAYTGDPLPPYTGLVRLNTDGSFDPSFTNFWGAGWVPYLRCLALQSDGKILVGGEFTEPRPGLVRFHADGRLDETFDPPPFPAYDGTGVNQLIVQPDNKILVGGDWGIGLVRLNQDGGVDTTFNSQLEAGSVPLAMLLLPDNPIVVGQSTCCGQCGTLVRLHPDGSMDASFAPQLDILPLTLVQQADGRLLAAGTVSDLGRDARIYLLNRDGIADSRFQAWVHAEVGVPRVSTMQLQPDGQILIGGWFSSVNQIPARAVARLNGEILPVMRALGQSAQGLRVELTGRPGAAYWIEVSTNLTDWAVARCVTNSSTGRCEFTDSPASEDRCRFFRARAIPPLR